MGYFIDHDRCIGCGACAEVCPTGCIQPTGDGKYELKEEECIECGVCISVCPTEAILSK